MATTMTTHTTTIPKITSKSMATSSSTDIATKFQKGMKRTGPPGGGAPGEGTPGGSGGPPGEGPPGGGVPGEIPAAPLAQQPIAPAQGVKAIGALPQTFDRDQTKAEDFIEEVKSYFCINYDVAGFNKPMKRMAFISKTRK